MRMKILILLVLVAILASGMFLVEVSPALSVSTDKTAYAPGDTVTITVKGNPGTAVGIEVKDPTGATEFVDQVTIGSGGTASTSFKLKSTARVGKWTVYASGGGETASRSFYVKYRSTISISVSPSRIAIGGSVTISGKISTTAVPSTATVTIKYKREGGSWNTLASVTASQGSYSYTWTPGSPGTYYLMAEWAGDETHFGASSNVVTLYVSAKKPSSISLEVLTPVVNIGDKARVKGKLTPAIAGVEITITYTKPDGTTITHKVKTDANGEFADEITVNMAGVWKVKASWPGNEQYEGATSPEVSFKGYFR